MNLTGQSLQAFTQRFCDAWVALTGHEPESEALYAIPSPCITQTLDQAVRWQPQPFIGEAYLAGVERALEISLRPEIHAFYTTQYAGDMPALKGELALTLLQAWSENDFKRVQENLIGHLVTQRRLRLSPTIFLATLQDDREVVSVCNKTGCVLLEKLGTQQREILADSLDQFLAQLHPVIDARM